MMANSNKGSESRASDLVLVPREPTPEMYAAASVDSSEQWFIGASYKAMVAAAPQPPAALGGEPEVWCLVGTKGNTFWRHGIPPENTALIDRAHLAPLLAEIERLRKENERLRLNISEMNDDARVRDSQLAERDAQILSMRRELHALVPDGYSNPDASADTNGVSQ